jgi:hypothetical protein
MTTTFIATSSKSVSAAAFKRMEKAIKAIDSSMDLYSMNQPGNSIRLYIERPNDGTNQNLDQRALNQKAAAIIA